jgi:ABC-2 type transport system ATP-binding protein
MCDRVGILEQGRLLATGTVDEIRRTLTQSRDIVVRIAGPTEMAMKLLATCDAVQDLRSDGATIHFAINGGDEEQIRVLHLLSDARIDVLEYSSRSESLEDVFLRITQGRVQ